MFTWTAGELDGEQTDAVLTPGSVFLVACPGSGKTRTLTYKCALELSRLESRRQFVAAITYTHRAADEIRDRIEALGVDTSNLWIGTIHSFCLEWILKPYGIYDEVLAKGFSVIDQHDREKLLDELCRLHPGSRVTFWDCDFFYESEGIVLGCQDDRKHPVIQEVLRSYFEALEASKLVDFELILFHARQLIGAHPAISSLLSKIFSNVLVDEFQDTKRIQYDILASIIRAGGGETKLFMVGDPNQAIYGSLGGSAISLEELRSVTGIDISECRLTQNYRSSRRLVEYFDNFNVHDTQIIAVGENRNYRSLVTYDDRISRDQLVYEIARIIRYNVRERGISPSNICVVAPQWQLLASMTKRLAALLPDYKFDGPGLVPFARDTENFWFKVSRLALTEPTPSMFVRRRRWAGEIIASLESAGIDVSGVSKKSILRVCNSIEIDVIEGLAFLRLFFSELSARLGIEIADYDQLRSDYEAFFASSEVRIAKLEQEGLEGVNTVDFFGRVFQNSSGVTVSTIHGVKGAEFDAVIAFGLLQGMVPHFSEQDGADSAKKLIYVVASRARKNLHLFSEEGRPKGRFGEYLPTEVLAECRFDYDRV